MEPDVQIVVIYDGLEGLPGLPGRDGANFADILAETAARIAGDLLLQQNIDAIVITGGGGGGEPGLQGEVGPTGPSGNVYSISTQATTYTLVSSDFANTTVHLIDIATANNLTVPAGLTGSAPVTIVQQGAGQVTFVAAAGVTIRSADGRLKTRAQYSSAMLLPSASGSNIFYLVGDLSI